MVTWPMTSREPQRCCDAVRPAILATAWLLVYKCMHCEFVTNDIVHCTRCNEIRAYRQFYVVGYWKLQSGLISINTKCNKSRSFVVNMLRCRRIFAVGGSRCAVGATLDRSRQNRPMMCTIHKVANVLRLMWSRAWSCLYCAPQLFVYQRPSFFLLNAQRDRSTVAPTSDRLTPQRDRPIAQICRLSVA